MDCMYVQAAILLSLVNDLLDISSVRHEIDKREAAGQWVAGRGGAGGSFPMRSEEERVRRANADSDAEVQSPPPHPQAPLYSFPLLCWNSVGPTALCCCSSVGKWPLDRVHSPHDCDEREKKRIRIRKDILNQKRRLMLTSAFPFSEIAVPDCLGSQSMQQQPSLAFATELCSRFKQSNRFKATVAELIVVMGPE